MKKYRITMQAIRTEIYEIEAANKEQAQENAIDGNLVSDDCSDWSITETKEVK